jgi:hypothetical protein
MQGIAIGVVLALNGMHRAPATKCTRNAARRIARQANHLVASTITNKETSREGCRAA